MRDLHARKETELVIYFDNNKFSAGRSNMDQATPPLFATLLATFLALSAGTADAELLKATWVGQISSGFSVGNSTISNGISPYLGWFDDLTSIDSTDIFDGAAVYGTVLIDTSLAPGDDEPAADLAIYRYYGKPLDVDPRFLTNSITVGGNVFRPATEPRPAEPIDPNDPSLSNQWVIRDQTPVGGPSAELTFLDQWNTYFGGIFQDRSVDLRLWNMPFAQGLPSPSEDLSEGFGYGSVTVSYGDASVHFPNSGPRITRKISVAAGG